MIVTQKFRGQSNIKRRGMCNNVVVDQSLITPIVERHTFKVSPVTFGVQDNSIVVSSASDGTFILADKLGITEETVLAGATIVNKDCCGVLVEVVSGGVYFEEGNDVYYLSAEGVCTYAPEVSMAKPSIIDKNERIISSDEHMLWFSGARLLSNIACCFNNKYRVISYDRSVRNVGEGLDNVVFEVIMNYSKDKIGSGWTFSYNLLNSYVDLALKKMIFSRVPKKVSSQPVLNYSRSKGDFENYEDLFSPIVNPDLDVELDETDSYISLD